MEKRKSPRVSLVKSLLCTVLCLGLLVGTTFAWFSDEAKTGDTTITAGNLDVQLQVKQEDGTFAEADDSTALFDDGVLWEPGMMWKSGAFKVVNAGNLALQYELTLEIAKGEGDADLSEVIQMKVAAASDLDGKEIATLEERRELWDSLTAEAGTDYTKGKLLPAGKEEVEGFKVGESDELAVVLFWNPSDSTDLNPEVNPDNKYNVKGGAALTADFSLNVFATQVPYESDSFGERYDNIYLAKNDEELRRAVESAGPGDLIDVLPGSYSGDDLVGLKAGVDLKGTVDDEGNPTTVVDVDENGLITSGGHISDVLFEKVGVDSTFPPLAQLSDGAVIENCEFADTRQRKNGRAIKVDGSATIRGCDFLSGDGIYNNDIGITGELLVEDCTFGRSVYSAIWVIKGTVDGHVTLRNCDFLGSDSLIAVGTTQDFKSSLVPGFGYVFWWDKDEKLIPKDGEKGQLTFGRGVTMENCTVYSSEIDIYTNWTMSGNTFQNGTNFYIRNYYLKIESNGDDFSGCTRTKPGYSGECLFDGKSLNNGSKNRIDILKRTTILIDGEAPNPYWVGEDGVTIPQ